MVGDGGTADVIRHELRTGELFSPTGHVQKGISELNKLQKIIRGQILSPSDLEIAKELIRDLQNALGG